MKSKKQIIKSLRAKVEMLARVSSEQRKRLELFEEGLAEMNTVVDALAGQTAREYGRKICDENDPGLVIGYRLELNREEMRNVISLGEIKCSVNEEQEKYTIGLILETPVSDTEEMTKSKLAPCGAGEDGPKWESDCVKVVRCKDCKYWERGASGDGTCEHMMGDQFGYSGPDDYCSYGVRRGENGPLSF